MNNKIIREICKLSDEELLKLVNYEFPDSRKEVVEFAKQESEKRGFVLIRTGVDFEIITPSGIRLTAKKVAVLENAPPNLTRHDSPEGKESTKRKWSDEHGLAWRVGHKVPGRSWLFGSKRPVAIKDCMPHNTGSQENKLLMSYAGLFAGLLGITGLLYYLNPAMLATKILPTLMLFSVFRHASKSGHLEYAVFGFLILAALLVLVAIVSNTLGLWAF